MEPPERGRRLIVNADDFGISSSANAAIVEAHRNGILTSASLMVGGAAFDEAVTLARQNPALGVGLHLTLVCGKAVLPRADIPSLVGGDGQFSNNPVVAGFKYFFLRSSAAQLKAEITAQFKKFKSTGLRCDHVNGHLNIHMHPTVLRLLIPIAREMGVNAMRLTCDPLRLNLKLASGRLVYRLSHWAIYAALTRISRPRLRMAGIRFTPRVFGLLQNGELREPFLEGLLKSLPVGVSEVYSHPSTDTFAHELRALTSDRVKALVRQLDIQLIRYQDLTNG